MISISLIKEHVCVFLVEVLSNCNLFMVLLLYPCTSNNLEVSIPLSIKIHLFSIQNMNEYERDEWYAE